MADKSSIEWTDATWNPIVGCSIVSPGCTNCYAMRQAPRTDALSIGAPWAGNGGKLTKPSKVGPVWSGALRFVERRLTEPMRWRAPRKVFVNSMSDLFHESVPDEWIDKIFAVMALCPQHTFQILTKRAGRMREYLSRTETPFRRIHHAAAACVDAYETWGWCRSKVIAATPYNLYLQAQWPLPNVWLGVSTERQQEADERIPHLLATPAAVRFISAEPLLGPIDLERYLPHRLEPPTWPKLHWVIVGGESGSGARPMHPEWARLLRDQCAAAGVSFFFKQWGEWAPIDGIDADGSFDYANHARLVSPNGQSVDWRDTDKCDLPLSSRLMERPGKKAAGRLLDGKEHNEIPMPRSEASPS